MKNIVYLLELEWLKVKNYRTFWILIGCFGLLLPMVVQTVSSINLPKEILSINTFLIFPTVWQTVACIGNWICFFVLGFIAVLSFTNEFTNRTLRQNIISGVSRTNFFLSKLLFFTGISLCATAFYTIIVLAYGFWHTETVYVSKITEGVHFILHFFLMSMLYLSFGGMVGMLLRKTGLSIFAYFSYIMFGEWVLRLWFFGKILGMKNLGFAPIASGASLTPYPFPNAAKAAMNESPIELSLDYQTAIPLCIAFIVLFFGITYKMLKDRDL